MQPVATLRKHYEKTTTFVLFSSYLNRRQKAWELTPLHPGLLNYAGVQRGLV